MARRARCSTERLELRLVFTVAVAGILGGACRPYSSPSIAERAALTTSEMTGDTAQSFYPEKNAAATAALIAAGNWDDTPGRKWTGPLHCGNGSTCGGKTEVQFRIRPRHNAHTFNHRRILRGDDPEQFIAEITNLDTVSYGPWRVGPNETVHLYVGLRATGDRRITIYRLDPIDGSRDILVTAQRATHCEVSAHSWPRVEVYTPWHCKGKADLRILYGTAYPASETSSANALPRLASNSMMTAAVEPFTSGLWISCSGGCCEGSAFQ
jgi:hypothetical protein